MKRMVFAALGLLLAGSALAASGKIDKDAISAAFKKAFPSYQVTDVQPTPMKGIALVELNGSDSVYASEDGQFLFTGDLIQLSDKGPVNLSEQRMQRMRSQGLAKVAARNMVTYKADGKEKAQVYAFTDTTCPYCRKMHSHMQAYNQAGITVHYLAFPRGGPGSKAAADMRHIWCSDDPQDAFTAANLHGKVTEAQLGDCAKAVNEQYEMGVRMGVRGTPAIYSVDGVQLGGYLSPEQMKQRLGL